MEHELEQLISDRAAHVAVIGLGYVGLPLVHAFNRAGYDVIGFDVDQRKVDALNRGESYIKTVEKSRVVEMVESGRFRATAEFRFLRKANAVIICVPTPLTKTREPDLSYIVRTGEEIRRYLERGQLIVLESTTYPGTTEEVLKPRRSVRIRGTRPSTRERFRSSSAVSTARAGASRRSSTRRPSTRWSKSVTRRSPRLQRSSRTSTVR